MNTTMTPPRIAATILVIIALVIAYLFFTAPDRRNGFERVGDAISELPNGPGKAADQLKDRTPAQKIGDAVEDAGDEIKQNVDR